MQKDPCFPATLKSAFSLVEMSIVLVIIGLLVGGVFTGQVLISNSELRNIQAGMEQTETAINAFRDKYLALPGDLANATQYWGAQDNNPSTCAITSSTTKLTCNGNGDGQVSYDTTAGSPTRYEPLRAWQHMANAELISGIYSGVELGGTTIRPGVNTFELKRSGVGINYYYDVGGGNIYRYNFPSGHYLNVGAWRSGNSRALQSAAVSAAEAYGIDSKIDDGFPHTGRMMSWGNYAWNPDCVVSANNAYNTTQDSIDSANRGPGCQFAYRVDS